MSTLDLGLIGNCSVAALVDNRARIVWWCLPRIDGDPFFHGLLGARTGDEHDGAFSIEIDGFVRAEQAYAENTAVLVTRLYAEDGSAIEIEDFCPRFEARGRMFRPASIVRRIRPVAGWPRVRLRIRPGLDWGARAPTITTGSSHIRWVGDDFAVRLTTDAPISYLTAETAFLLDRPIACVIGPDETLSDRPETIARSFCEETTDYWRRWSRRLGLPHEFQDAVIRAAITLKLCTVEDTGAIVAAVTTSVPEFADSGRNWDYRYCWLRDAFFVIRALNALSAVEVMELYLRYLNDIMAITHGGHVQPVWGVGLEQALVERTVDLPGYRGMGPVRVGNQAYEHFQHDVYGNIILGASQAFFDRRLLRPWGLEDFRRMEAIGARAYAVYNQPDAGMWELRTRARVHTSSSLMCWAALDRLAKIAVHLGLDGSQWRARADEVRAAILDQAWNPTINAFAESFGGKDLDASLLLMAEVGFIDPNDPRFRATVDLIGKELRRGNHMFRYRMADDFGVPHTAFTVCTFWYIDAVARIGRREEAREIYESVLACRNPLGLLSEDVDPATGTLWGNFPQTYSMVGIINGAMRLSSGWETVI
ncbi:glycoside hydrolase family 15 protein [Segnochrobactrum spirostomi]|uniref:Glycoside hydrolase family 15 protein n=1 Tax=Segnochrobactrum spirostomi TaxID=2608987 RepID=A0A6A7Y1H1_9HYPH|nr:glycoside hydrolase family 15 protein [Segnochrobactrum spirostomi]MQT12526.1 glycoside hydrolase family 15 protein [Segnochrobactrum spirostomi]